MYVDKELQYSNEQAVTATADSTNIVDHGAAGDAYPQLFLVVTCDVTVASSGSATVDFDFQTDDNDAFSSGISVFKKSAVPKATLVAGYVVMKTAVPHGLLERYSKLIYTVNTADLSAGKFSAQLVKDVKIGSQ